MNQLIGTGKVSNGRIMFSTVDGKGFSQPVSRKEETKTVEAPVVKKEQADLVFDFVSGRKHKRSVAGTVIHVDFGKQEEEALSRPEQIVDASVSAVRKAVNPLIRFFEGESIKNLFNKEEN